MTRISLWINLTAASAIFFWAPLAAAQDEEEEEPREVELDSRRSPELQARAAIRSGDFRVARLVFEHSDEVGHFSFGAATPGLACDGQIGDASARDLSWGKEERRFAAAYNAELLADRNYPDRDVCVPLGTDGDDPEWPDFSKAQGRPLHPPASVNRAARASRPDLARAQIAAGRPFDAWDRWFRRPLHWAARRGDLESLDLLLAAGARTDEKEPVPALLLAADSGHTAAVERLLAAGASPLRCGKIDVRLSWGSSNSGSRLACPLRQAIERDFAGPVAPLVKAIIARGAYSERERLIGDLYKAVELGRTSAVRAFVQGSGESRNRYLQPAVMRMAAYRLDRPMLRTLLALGGGNAARTPAEERLWLAAARLARPEPLAMLVWFGRDLNYLPAAERAGLEAALPTLSAAALRPFLVRAAEAREKAWDSVLAGDVPALEAMAAAGVDFAERRGNTALSRAAGSDAAITRWMLARGARPDTYENDEVGLGCSSVSDDFGRNKHSREQRESFVALCEEEESREPRPRPQVEFGEHALVTALRSGDRERVDLLFPGARPEAALDAITYLIFRAPADTDRLRFLTRLAALAGKGHRSEVAAYLSDFLQKKDKAAAAAVLAGFVPAGAREVRFALDIGYDQADRCRIDHFRFLGERGVELSDWRDLDGGNLFARAADCDSAEFVAFAATVSGIGVNDVNEIGRTALESVAWGKREGAAAKAMIALGAKSCEDLHGEDSDRCGSAGIRPDPAL